MNITCPACDHEIESENIIAEKDYGFCIICQKEFELSDIFIVPNVDNQETMFFDLHIPPKGTWINESSEKIVIGAIERDLAGGIFLLILTLTMITGAIIFTFFIDGISAYSIFAGILCLSGSCFFAPFAIKLLAGKVEIIIGKESYVYKGVWKKGIKEIFDWNTVVKIDKTKIKNRETYITIKAEGKTMRNFAGKITNKIYFGGDLTETQRYFILNALQYYHNKKILKNSGA